MRALVSWRGSGSGNANASDTPGPVLAAVRPAGQSFTQAAQLAAGGAYAPAVAAGAPGSGIVAWGHAAGSGCTQIESSLLTDGTQGALAALGPACTTRPPRRRRPPGKRHRRHDTDAAVADHRGPRLKLSTGKQHFAKKGVIALRIACDETCSGTVVAKVEHTTRKSKTSAKVKTMRVIRLSTAKFRVRGGHHTTVRYKLTAGQVTAIKKMLTNKGKATFVAIGRRLRRARQQDARQAQARTRPLAQERARSDRPICNRAFTRSLLQGRDRPIVGGRPTALHGL